jgi:hypothetical protein
MDAIAPGRSGFAKFPQAEKRNASQHITGAKVAAAIPDANARARDSGCLGCNGSDVLETWVGNTCFWTCRECAQDWRQFVWARIKGRKALFERYGRGER